MLTFEELAHELDLTYTKGYTDRDGALEDFGRRHSADLAAMGAQGRTMEELVDAAKIGPAEHWANVIRMGMSELGAYSLDWIRGLEKRLDDLEELTATLATKKDLKDELSGVAERLKNETHAAEDHLIGEISKVNQRVKGQLSDLAPVQTRLRDG